MKTLLIVSIFIVSELFGQNVKSQNLNLSIDVITKSISVEGKLDVDFQGKDSINFVLWKRSSIQSIDISGKPVKYLFDTQSASPIMYIPSGSKLTIVKPSGGEDEALIHFQYDCDMKDLSGWANSFSDKWIELNFYCAWFPVCLNDRGYTSKITVTINDEFEVSGSGIVRKIENNWEMIQPWESFDLVIIASENLESKILNEKNVYIRTDYNVMQNADSILTECKFILNLFENYFGKKDSSYLKFVFAPFEKGGGYSRKNFVCLRTTNFDIRTRSGIAHETAHFWWTGASTSTWDDWLNEAFAEYSMLMYIRERFGEEAFEKKIEAYKNETKNMPPVWGIERNDNDAYSVLYEKGSVILYEFEKKVGIKEFQSFLKELVKNNIKTTEQMLIQVENQFSSEIKDWLVNKLKTA